MTLHIGRRGGLSSFALRPAIAIVGIVLISAGPPEKHFEADSSSWGSPWRSPWDMGTFKWQEARLALVGDDYQTARDTVQGWLVFFPDVPAFHLAAARIERNLGNLKAAERHLKQCLKLQGAATEASKLESALLRSQQGLLDDVEQALWGLVRKKHTESPAILETLTDEYARVWRYQAAAFTVDQWCKLEPKNVRALACRALVFERLCLEGTSIEAYQQALEQAPQRWQIRLHLAQWLLETQDVSEAKAQLEKLAKSHAKNTDVIVTLARLRLMEANLEEARGLLDGVLKTNPSHRAALLLRGKPDLLEDRCAEAEKSLRKALVADPTNVEIHHDLYLALRRQPGREKEARAQLEREQQLRADTKRLTELLPKAAAPPRDAKITSEVGILFLRLGNEEPALYWLHATLKLDPDHAATHRALADHYETKKDLEKAKFHRQKLRP